MGPKFESKESGDPPKGPSMDALLPFAEACLSSDASLVPAYDYMPVRVCLDDLGRPVRLLDCDPDPPPLAMVSGGPISKVDMRLTS